jgi:hypothetical protein
VLDRLTHAAVDLGDPTNLQFGYVRRFADATAPLRAELGASPDVLHIGGGGFTFPRYIEAMHPDARQTVLELDPRIYEIAQSELGYVPSERIDVRLGDARQSIRALPSDAFDVVVGDAFGGLAVPWHLTTTEMLDEIVARAAPGWEYVMNIIDYPPLRFVRAETATAATVFSEVSVIAAGRSTARRAAISCSLGAIRRSKSRQWRRPSRPGGRGPQRPFSLPLTRCGRSSVRHRRSPMTTPRSTSSWGASKPGYLPLLCFSSL